MPIKRYKPEQIVTTLRQIEVSVANGKTTPQACKEAEITMQTFYRWRKEYGGLKMDQAKRLKELEKENGKLKRSEVSWDGKPLPARRDGMFVDLTLASRRRSDHLWGDSEQEISSPETSAPI